MCTCYQNETSGIKYQTQLCSVFDLVPTFHTLVITHAGSNGLWLNIDDLQYVLIAFSPLGLLMMMTHPVHLQSRPQ